MDGLRKNLSSSYNSFVRQMKYDEDFNNLTETQKDKLDDLRGMIGALNCCYDPDDKEDWNEIDIILSDVFEDED